jgi:DNA-directed RNA polymerase specialized sigma24 family protein
MGFIGACRNQSRTQKVALVHLVEGVKTKIAKVDAKRFCELYATSVDFCRVFNDHMNHLYTCAFLLLADHTKAEQCFVKSLEDCLAAGPVFTNWTVTYAHRTIVKTALEMFSVSRSETLIDRQSQEKPKVESCPNGHPLAAAITSLPIFQRFVYVLSVLEGYSDGECASLLASGIAEIVAARTEALEELVRLAATIKPEAAESLASQKQRGHAAASSTMLNRDWISDLSHSYLLPRGDN